ncbi:MAG: DNA-deoxyinosine glycosylase [Alistipes sp.]
MSLKLQSFEPIADRHSRVLVLGTMPGAMSLAKGQYYGHPRNAFWPIMARLCGRDLPEDYAQRKAMLLDAGIALWDVCGECEREGSLDSNICHEKPNRIDELLRRYPSIRAIAFNGQGAARLQKTLRPAGIEYGPLILPSTSPAHAVAFDKKLDGWMRLRDLLVPADDASRP